MMHCSGSSDILLICSTAGHDGVDYTLATLAEIETDFDEVKREQFASTTNRRGLNSRNGSR
jgi:hypothetical protein